MNEMLTGTELKALYIVRRNWCRGDRVMKPISVWGWWGGHVGQRPMGKFFGQDAGVTSLLFFKGHPGIFNDHRVMDLGLTSHSKDGAFYSTVSLSLYLGVRTHTDCRVSTLAGLTNTSSSSDLVFTGGLPSRYWPGTTLLSFSGQPVLGCRVKWLLATNEYE